ncbi:hypothetical protein Sme01_58570 [Sphaerisporangium melleum]|uniref:Uncharacterized protein n=1 Tax=Sphaerisporangium melleum TaxID=321316 RepID=A0A917R7X1_9ACTN|nr:hypothetical protein GCM10007964_40200 [Sphaerisporangium melleum]GII73381.1 hypothetical protein Sme01_58570 [Sphaerisporangium melleum]
MQGRRADQVEGDVAGADPLGEVEPAPEDLHRADERLGEEAEGDRVGDVVAGQAGACLPEGDEDVRPQDPEDGVGERSGQRGGTVGGTTAEAVSEDGQIEGEGDTPPETAGREF